MAGRQSVLAAVTDLQKFGRVWALVAFFRLNAWASEFGERKVRSAHLVANLAPGHTNCFHDLHRSSRSRIGMEAGGKRQGVIESSHALAAIDSKIDALPLSDTGV